MTRVLGAALTLALLVGARAGLPSGSVSTRLVDSRPVASRSANRGPCDEERWRRITPRESREHPGLVPGLIGCAARRWDVYGGASKARSVADCESSYFPQASSPSGSYLGVYQQSAEAWRARVHAYLERDWFSDYQWRRIDRDASIDGQQGAAYLARANVLLSVRMAHRGGWGPWTCA